MLCIECRVWSVECRVWSVECRVYISWVCAFKRGALTYGQVKYRVRGWIRELGKNRGRPTVSYQEWLEWMKENHDNSYDHILG